MAWFSDFIQSDISCMEYAANEMNGRMPRPVLDAAVRFLMTTCAQLNVLFSSIDLFVAFFHAYQHLERIGRIRHARFSNSQDIVPLCSSCNFKRDDLQFYQHGERYL